MLQQFSVGAINAIGAKCLARKDAEVVALFGAGGQAGPQIRGRIQGRTNPQQRTFFLNSTGCGAQYSAVAT